jgi:hypothetical protein
MRKKIASQVSVSILSIVLLSSCQEKVKTEVSLKNDTLVTKVLNIEDKKDLEKNGFYAEEKFVVANKAYLRKTSDKNQSNTVLDTLKFGDKVYIKSVYYDEESGEGVNADESLLEDEKANGYVAVYLKKPKSLNEKPIGYVSEKVLTHAYEFEKYKKSFSLPEFQKLDSRIKQIILESSYHNGKNYEITESAQKAPNAICFGDFDGDGLKDVAVVLDNVEKETSLVLVMLMNAATKEPYIAFKQEFNEYLKVKKKPKNSLQTLADDNSNPYTKVAALDFVEIYGVNSASYVIYDEDSNKMKLE